MKIVILDGYVENPGDLSWAGLEALGDLVVYDRTPFNDDDEILRRIADAEVVLTNKTPLTKNVLDKAPCLKFISMLATGYNVVDAAAARAKGIALANIPTYGTAAVAQFAIALLLEVCHHVGHHSKAVEEGRWATSKDWCFWDYPLIELADKTMGVIGLGRIGRATATAAAALGMKVIAYDSFQDEAGRKLAEYTELDDLFARSDVIALHCPLFPATEGIINKSNIAKMKDGVIIINNSRGQLVVEQDLADALNSGKVYAAGLGVVSAEPIKDDNPLLKAKNCIITPHISWAPKESRQRLMDIVIANVQSYLDKNPINVVN
ncbi:MAG: D-2-hydroxyacid dehydrogenase [Oscillospiraceae bacterium]|nr:D-2-hydroxyacid dehydrogenase [Oscillospiraceae bacterium]